MSKLEELIARLCPDGVEYKELGELFRTKNGYTPSKSNKEYWENGNIPWFRMEEFYLKQLKKLPKMLLKESCFQKILLL